MYKIQFADDDWYWRFLKSHSCLVAKYLYFKLGANNLGLEPDIDTLRFTLESAACFRLLIFQREFPSSVLKCSLRTSVKLCFFVYFFTWTRLERLIFWFCGHRKIFNTLYSVMCFTAYCVSILCCESTFGCTVGLPFPTASEVKKQGKKFCSYVHLLFPLKPLHSSDVKLTSTVR